LKYLNENATDTEIEDALKIAHMHKEIYDQQEEDKKNQGLDR